MHTPTTWPAATRAWVGWLRTGSVSRNTVNLRVYQLGRLADAAPCGPWMMSAGHLERWMAGQEWSRETRRSYLSAVRSFYGWAHARGYIDHDPSRLLRRVKPAHASPRPATETDIGDALAAADDRVYLMITLGARHGLRRGEIARIHRRDLVEDVDGWSLLVHGKGDKPRTIPLLSDTAASLREADGWVFPNGKGSHLSAAHVGVLIRRALPAGVVPHMLRHRFATRFYRQTRDILNLQQLLGHASVATTQRYAAPDRSVLRALMREAA